MSFKSSDDNLKAVETVKSSHNNNLGIKTKSVDTDTKSGNASYSNTSYKSKRQVCFIMFDNGKTTKEVLKETGYSSSLITQYYQQWKREKNIKTNNNKAIEDKAKAKEPVKVGETENKLDEFVDNLLSKSKKEEEEKASKQKSSLDEFVDKLFSDIEPNKESTEKSIKDTNDKTSAKNKAKVNDTKKEAEKVMTKEEKTSIKVADADKEIGVKKEVVKLVPHQVLATYNLNGITGVVKNNKKVALDLGLDKYLTKEELNQLIDNLKALEKGLK